MNKLFNRFHHKHRMELNRWHISHGPNGNDPPEVEAEYICTICGKISYVYYSIDVARDFEVICPEYERRKIMLWNPDISFDGFQKKIKSWYEGKDSEICDPPIDAQFALDLIFKTLIDDKENYPYLTTIPESTEQVNSIMLDLILTKYSRKYRKFKKEKGL